VRSTLDPTLDIVFKMLFASPASRDTLIALLSAVLEPASPIVDAQVLNPEITREQVDDKGITLDVLVRLTDGTRLNVEMQTEKRPAFRNRALYYWSRVFGSQLERGQPYTVLAPVISILFLDYRELAGLHMHSTFRILDVHDQTLFTDALEIHVIELPKRLSAAARQTEPTLLAWSRFLGARTDREVEEACMDHPEIAEANRILAHLSASPSAQELARQRQLALDTYRIEITAAVRQGRADLLVDLLREKFGTLDEVTLQRVRSASDDAILRWSRKVLTAASLADVLSDS
jgi:predicted transposase/invertase (TIGR01784 family)